MGFHIDSLAFVIAVGAAMLAALVAVVVLRHRGWLMRIATGVLATLTVVAFGLAVANAYYRYIPTIGNLVGNQRDGATLTQAIKKEYVPGSQGSLVEVNIPNPNSHFSARPAQIYLPPAWSMNPRPKLPVVMLFHGTPGAPQDWARGGGATEVADEWAKAHGGYAPIIVLPDINGGFLSDTECVDGKAGNAETYLTRDVRSFVVSTFDADPAPDHWAVGGLSEGGYCGAMLTLRHPDLFNVFLDFGGDDKPTATSGAKTLFGGNSSDVAAMVERYSLGTLAHQDSRVASQLSGWIICGQDDTHDARASVQFGQLARASGIDVQVRLLGKSRHTFQTWKTSLEMAFPDVAGRIGALPPGSPPPPRMATTAIPPPPAIPPTTVKPATTLPTPLPKPVSGRIVPAHH